MKRSRACRATRTPIGILQRFAFSTGAKTVLSAAAVFLLVFCSPLHGQAGPAEMVKGAVKGATGETSSSTGENSVNPYQDKEPPETFKGWGDYLLNFPVYKTGGEWIRLHQLLWALFMLIAGLWVSVLTGRGVKAWMVKIKRIPMHIAIAVSKGLVYLLAFLVVIATVLFVGMPFSVVTVLGAVVLLGASLGAKSTIYDYMSGLVLALEQPIRIGDCIEVDQNQGFVDEIRGRYTRVRRFDGIDVLVPNSTFLEHEVVNWTLHDTKLRGEIEVGVSYASDVDETMGILMDCMGNRKDIMPTPQPSVLFWAFGESALVFRMFFWVKVDNPLDLWTVESELRRAAFEQLKAADIHIAYPQRDLHLDSRQPVRIVLQEEGRDVEAEGDSRERKRGAASKAPQKETEARDEEQVAKPGQDNPRSHQENADKP